MPTVIPICCRVRVSVWEDKHYIVVKNQIADMFLSFVALVMLSFSSFVGLMLAYMFGKEKLFNVFAFLALLVYCALTVDLFIAWFYGRHRIGGIPLENREPGPINTPKPKLIVSTKPVYVIRKSFNSPYEAKSGFLAIDHQSICKPLAPVNEPESVSILMPDPMNKN